MGFRQDRRLQSAYTRAHARHSATKRLEVQPTKHAPLVAGVLYFSGLEPGWGYLFKEGIGRPLEISGFTTVASPEKTFFSPRTSSRSRKNNARNFFQKPFGETWYRVGSANFLDAIFDWQGWVSGSRSRGMALTRTFLFKNLDVGSPLGT